MKPVLAVAVAILGIASLAVAQTPKPYTVTAKLQPTFADPETGRAILEPGETLQPIYGLRRGADGAFYGLLKSSGHFAIMRVSPTTGAQRILYVLWAPNNLSPSEFYVGAGGRLYFTMAETGDPEYAAPDTHSDVVCGYGCVLMLDTMSGGRQLTMLFDFIGDTGNDVLGYYPRDGIALEDADGAVYVYTDPETLQCDDNVSWSEPLVKVSSSGDVTLLQGCGTPEFDWSTVTRSGNDDWHWSDGDSYYTAGTSIYQRDASTESSKVIATVNLADGVLQDSIVEGSGYLYGITCCGGANGAGVVFRVRVPSLASPNLHVPAVTTAAETAVPGQAFGVTDVTRNSGPEPAAASVTKYHLSLTGAKADVKLSGNRYLPELGPGEWEEGTRNVKVPASAPLGTYWLVACADAQRAVAESNDEDNCAVAASPITIGKPDLSVSAVAIGATVAAPGTKIGVSSTVENLGSASSPETLVRYSLVPVSGPTIVLSGTSKTSPLAPGASSSQSRKVAIPSTTATGIYHLLVCADYKGKIAELNESNNCRSSDATLTVR